MRRWLYQLHRWLGIILAPLVLLWFISGLVMLYASPSAVTEAQRLAHAAPLHIRSGWLTLREAWTRNSARHQHTASAYEIETIANARLVQQAAKPWWLITNSHGKHFRISARSGKLQTVSPQTALAIAHTWAGQDSDRVAFVATVAGDNGTRMYTYNPYRPFHRIALHDHAGTELLISARTGEVIRATTRVDRVLTLTGSWLHFLRPLDSLGLKHLRKPTLAWGDFTACLAVLFGLVIGWLRWRPGWFGTRRYSKGRVHPYRWCWSRWHFWLGLIGGIMALGWTFSGFLAATPWQWFSPKRLTAMEKVRYLGAAPPDAMLDWHPSPIPASYQPVELSWRHLGSAAALLAYDHNGRRYLVSRIAANNTLPDIHNTGFASETLLLASQRLLHYLPLRSYTYLRDYDSYYYPNHRHDIATRPLPVLRVELLDARHTLLYIDPFDGRVVARLDRSRQVYRWLFSALHSWDFGWLYFRPWWDIWMVPWLLLGIALSVTSLVIGWKRLRRVHMFRRKKIPASPLPD
jgi:hypothetical protein